MTFNKWQESAMISKKKKLYIRVSDVLITALKCAYAMLEYLLYKLNEN